MCPRKHVYTKKPAMVQLILPAYMILYKLSGGQ